MLKKIYKNYISGGFEQVLRKLNNKLFFYILVLFSFIKIKKNNFVIKFPYDGNRNLKIPQMNLKDFFKKKGLFIAYRAFAERPYKESGLRTIVNTMINYDYIKSGSIIDIGAWLSDNALLWAKMIENKGQVIAIDPSNFNLEFGKLLSKENEIKNIKFVKAICMDTINLRVKPLGNIDHTAPIAYTGFIKTSDISNNDLITTTIDEIVKKDKISLIHLDVEGSEYDVLKGSINTISNHNPFIIFEQHMKKDNTNEILKFLKKFNYEVFFINEKLPINDPDCKNLIAIPNGIDVDFFITTIEKNLSNMNIAKLEKGNFIKKF